MSTTLETKANDLLRRIDKFAHGALRVEDLPMYVGMICHFADSLSAELRAENKKLRDALERLIIVFVQRELDTDDFDELENARAALAQEKAK